MVVTVMDTVGAVHNISAVASAVVAAGAHSFDTPDATTTAPSPPGLPPPSPQPGAGGRALLQQPQASIDAAMRAAATDLLYALTDKVNQFDAAAPGNFLTWVTATTPGPYIRQLLNTARYGEATMASVLRALGTTVDPALAGPDLIGHSR